MLKIVDNEEFYEQEKPLSLKDLKSLILILKQVYTRKYHLCVIITELLLDILLFSFTLIWVHLQFVGFMATSLDYSFTLLSYSEIIT